jgi:AcrR family transcriptional regulator
MASGVSKGATTREAILRSAAFQFRLQGYGSCTLDDIAQSLGITRAAILYHFSSKEELLEAVIGPYLTNLAGVLARHQASGDDSPAARRRIIVDFVDAACGNPSAAGILYRDTTSWQHPWVRERAVDGSDAFRNALTGENPTAEMRALATCLLGALLRPLIDPDLDPSSPEVRAAVLDVTFGIAARIDRLRRQKT